MIALRLGHRLDPGRDQRADPVAAAAVRDQDSGEPAQQRPVADQHALAGDHVAEHRAQGLAGGALQALGLVGGAAARFEAREDAALEVARRGGGGGFAAAEQAPQSVPGAGGFGRGRGRLVEQGREFALQHDVGFDAHRLKFGRNRREPRVDALAQERGDDAPEVQAEIGIDLAHGDRDVGHHPDQGLVHHEPLRPEGGELRGRQAA